MINRFLERVPRKLNGAKNDLVGQLDIHRQKNEVGHLPHTIYKNYLKMDQSRTQI